MKNEAMVLKLEQASLHAYRMTWNFVTGILATGFVPTYHSLSFPTTSIPESLGERESSL